MQPVEMELWKAKDVARLLSLVEADRRYFQELVAALPVPVAVVSADLTLTSSNRAFRELFQLKPNELAGTVDQILQAPDLTTRVKTSLESKAPASGEFKRSARAFPFTLQPIRHWEEEEVIVVVQEPRAAGPAAVSTPTTTAVSPALPELPFALWSVDAASMKFLSDAHLAGLGSPADGWKAGSDFLHKTGNGDAAAVRDFYQAVLAGKPLSSCDYQTVNASGATVWLRDLVRPIRGTDGKIARLEGLTLDITEARRADSQRAQAQRIEALSRLASRVVHDCNNLIMIMGGYGEDLLHALPPESSLRVNVQEILAAGDRLSVFTRQLNAFTKRAPVQVKAFVLDDMLTGLKDELSRPLPSSIQLSVSCRSGVRVLADPVQLGAILQTLVQRAAGSLHNGGLISIQSTVAAGGHILAGLAQPLAPGMYARIEVRDTGIAIHPDVLGRLFEPDTSPDPVRQRLPAAYQTLRDMGCDLEAVSHPGDGTGFHIVLPLATEVIAAPAPFKAEPVAPPPPAPVKPAPVVEPQPTPVKPKVKEIEERPIFMPPLPAKPAEPRVAAPAAPQAAVAPPPPPPIPMPPKPPVAEPVPMPAAVAAPVSKGVVLVVDDEAGIRSLIRKVLLREGYEVLEATQGREGLEVAKAHQGRIHLLLSDVVMPEMGGVEFAQALHKVRPETKILLISGYMGAAGLETESLPRGTSFLQKPFTLNALIAKVKEVLGPPNHRPAAS